MWMSTVAWAPLVVLELAARELDKDAERYDREWREALGNPHPAPDSTLDVEVRPGALWLP